MTQTTQTCLWNDSASIQELTYSIEHGAVGATCNPVIVVGVLVKEMNLWEDRIRNLIDEMPVGTRRPDRLELVREISIKGARLLEPILDAHGVETAGSLCRLIHGYIATPRWIFAQAEEFARLAPNIIVKIP